MKTINELLSHLNSLDVKLWTESSPEATSEVRLRCNAPKDVLTPNLKTELAQRKAEILEFLLQLNLSSTPIQPFSRTGNIPLSFAQQRLWFLDRLEPGNPFYNQPSAWRLTGELQVAVLEQSLREIIRRHEILRTTFTTVTAQTIQIIKSEVDFQLSVIDLTNLSPTQKEREVKQLAQQEAEKPFNLEQDLLLRVTLLKCGCQEHTILFTTHHIVSDNWSTGILIQEIATLYQAFLSGKPSPLPELSIQYADFAVWQRQWLQGKAQSTQLNYWKQQLGSNPPILNLPTDYPRPIKLTYQGSNQSFTISPSLTQALKALCQKEGVTLFMLLLAAFKVLLHRYSQQEDILVGTPIANRNRAEIEGLIGFFVNTLVLRTNIEGNPSFKELLQRVKQVTLGAYSNQDLPFERLVEELKPERHLNRNPLFDVMFALQNAPESELTLPGLTLSSISEEGQTAKFDLSLYMFESPSGLAGVFEYSTDLFKPSTIKRMVEHFQVLLKAIATQLETSVLQLPLLTKDETQQLLVEWNDTEVDYPQDKYIHTLFEVQVEKTPDAIAVIFENQQLTYQELNTKANQLAHYLQKQGVRPEERVGICLERSLELVIALLATLKAGGAYIPLDPSYPLERLAFMLENSQASILITQQFIQEKLPPHQAQVVFLEREQKPNAEESKANPNCNLSLDNLAYVIYTSGSTGKPKGAMNTHRGILNRLLWMQDAYQLTTVDSVLQKTPFSFDVSVWEFFWCLMVGARLIVAKPEGHRDPNYLIDLIRKNNITTLHFVPSMLKVFLEAEGLEHCRSLKRVICSGEELSFPLQQKFFARLDCELYNLYGPTEAAIDVTYWQCQPECQDSSRCEASPLGPTALTTIPIGRPIANTQIYILNRDLQPVPIGVGGELHIGGVGLARGYLNQPELTKEKFIENPFSKGRRLYKTGDLARYLSDGSIEYLGRIDNQIKIRGFRIELGEIEAVVAKHSAIKDCVVIPWGDQTGDKRLVAYYLAQEQLDSQQLREYLKSKLPDYMIPAALMELEAFPLTPSGKCARNSLPIPDLYWYQNQETYISPRTPQEEIIANIWQEVLNLKQVGIDNNFFELGGHSLLATQVISKIRQSLSTELPLRCLFEHPTVAELAKQLDSSIAAEIPPITPVAREGDLPLSFAQQRLWFLAQLKPDSPAYNIPEALRLQGKLNIDVLIQTLEAIIERHEILRTSFQIVTDEPIQVIHPEINFQLPIIDLTNLLKTEREQEVTKLAEQEALKPFCLEQDCLLRVTLIRLSDIEHIILFTMHHIISDGWSTGILVQEVATLYQAFLSGKPSPLPELPIQYADYAVWQRNYLQGEVLDRQLNYWKSKLGGELPILKLPIANPRLNVRTFRGGQQPFVIAKALSDELKNFSIKHDVTLFMTLLTAFQTLLHWYTNQEDMLIGTDIANRHQSEIENLIGFFVNQLVLRSDFSGNPSFPELLTRTRHVTLDAYANQDLPFEKLVEVLNPKRSLSHTPLFQVKIILQNTPISSLELPGLIISSIDLDKKIAEYDLLLDLEDTEAGLNGLLKYDTDLFSDRKIAELLTNLKLILSTIARRPELQLGELKSILSCAAKQQHQSQEHEYQIALSQKLGKVQRKSLM
ncbi:non-ribosomal peptide synthetase [Pleurocapsa sp. CCALA 161]|uniref:non-ribosomal peptide synthetase n=1 Tax=Pleurocapsa sp. CCALA 161 TaxID=2107688 RepID=UPI000D070CF5|nr:non-ribosomal peptide synthetase [Pleurocapsa sp. CCALA 161]PSB11067.1 non-ribosomal peptide synthetase [Pleurocapsa sp. CCALA 161]